MTEPVRETQDMIAGMSPSLDPQRWCFVTIADQGQAFALMPHALATFREQEGLSLIVPQEAAHEAGMEAESYARITLQVHSALDGVGLTAAVATALADAGIACNMVAAFHHDHAFVPAEQAEEALGILGALSRSAGAAQG
ncbi:MAG: ACT domain-containing protein [Pontixanthobacter sp.]